MALPSTAAPPTAAPPTGDPVTAVPVTAAPGTAVPTPGVTPTLDDGPDRPADVGGRPGAGHLVGWRRPSRSRAEWAGLLLLLAGTAVAYLWGLDRSGYANSFYAAAVEAGTRSWKAFFFGSLDPSNFITVDKPPASLWVMDLSARLFGFGSWSLLVPQALEGVGTVALVYAVVRRWYGPRPALLAGAVMATTPVAALMFRFDNPDALLVLLLTLAAYAVTRAVERAGTRWLVLAGAAVGFAFLAKMGQALLVVPAMGVAYVVAAPTGLRRRLGQLLAAGAALVLSAGWWVLAVTLWPAADRPMIDGSPTNSIWNLIVDYNGLGRIVGGGSGGPGGTAGPGSSFSGSTGMLRLFNDLMGAQASWLLPASVLVLVAGLAVTRRAPRTDRTRAALLLWGGWLLVTAAVFSFSRGIIHTYYTVALAPAIAVLIGVGAALAARHWPDGRARVATAAAVAATAAWAVVLLDRAPQWSPWLRPLVVVTAVVAVAGLVAAPALRSAGGRRAVLAVGVGAAVLAGLAGPAAYALQTIGSAHTGSVPSAGPAVLASTGSAGFPGPGGGAASLGLPGGGTLPAGGTDAGGPPTGASGLPSSGASGAGPSATARPRPSGESGALPGGGAAVGSGPPGLRGGAAPAAAEGLGRGAAVGSGPAGPGGGGSVRVASALVRAIESDAGRYRWVAATDGSQGAASLELATGGDAVMAIGGFNGQGGNISLARFEAYVRAGDIHYYVVSGGGAGGGGPGGGGGSGTITSWVASHFTARTIGGTTVYVLTGTSR